MAIAMSGCWAFAGRASGGAAAWAAPIRPSWPRPARIGRRSAIDEINLNVGCPSDRVQSGRFGACLMAEPALVAECVRAMRAATDLPVTVKCRHRHRRPGHRAEPRPLCRPMVEAGVDALYVHARKAWLKGLSPKENRTIPPLDYPRVYRLAQRLAPLPV
jgi:tRNA-dihydrouridine synthase A